MGEARVMIFIAWLAAIAAAIYLYEYYNDDV
jgi:ABC-type phosphate transport system permease subunit